MFRIYTNPSLHLVQPLVQHIRVTQAASLRPELVDTRIIAQVVILIVRDLKIHAQYILMLDHVIERVIAGELQYLRVLHKVLLLFECLEHPVVILDVFLHVFIIYLIFISREPPLRQMILRFLFLLIFLILLLVIIFLIDPLIHLPPFQNLPLQLLINFQLCLP